MEVRTDGIKLLLDQGFDQLAAANALQESGGDIVSIAPPFNFWGGEENDKAMSKQHF